MTFTEMRVTAIDSDWDVQVTGGSMTMVAGLAWRVTAKHVVGGQGELIWTGRGDCPWRINQRLQITIAPYPEGVQ